MGLMDVADKMDETPYKCDLPGCTSMFRYPIQLANHKFEVHNDLNEIRPCGLCGAQFNTEKKLQNHHRSVHVKTYKFTCGQCDKVFYNKGAYEGHMNEHMGIKPFKCQDCDASFYRNRHLISRRNYIHIGIRKHKCTM